MRSHRLAVACIVAWWFAPCCCVLAAARGEFVPLTNPDFTHGQDGPAGWTLSGGEGRWVDGEILEVRGNGIDSNFWRCDYRFRPGGLYRFQARGRGTPGSGTAITGPVFANRDFRGPTADWVWAGHVFRVPDDVSDSYVRLGQWHAAGTIQFDAVRLVPVLAVHQDIGGLILGEGESIRGGRYAFSGSFVHEGSNYHRTLDRATARFNSDRWCFGSGDEVIYRFAIPDHPLGEGRIRGNINYHTAGGCRLEASRDGQSWHDLATCDEPGPLEARLPEDLRGAPRLFVRFRALPGPCNFQINRVELEAELTRAAPEGVGRTLFAAVSQPSSGGVQIESITTRSTAHGRIAFRVTARNPGPRPAVIHVAASDEAGCRAEPTSSRVAAGEAANWTCTLPAGPAGQRTIEIALNAEGQPPTTATVEMSVPDYYRTDYGKRIARDDDTAAVWWCRATHKVAPLRPPPAESSPAAELSAARNDFEAVQVVVRPGRALGGLRATASDLEGPGGAAIARKNVKILRVAYHFVHHPTDHTGVRDWWPDALPPLKEPIDVPAGKNQPLWVLVHVPGDARPGDYTGRVSLRAEGWAAEVPLRLHVWNFALPERNHLETAFGLSAGNVFRYHQLTGEADKRRVWQMYLQSFAEHRISPYDPTPLDPIRVRFLPEADPPRAELDFSAFDRAMARAAEQFQLTNFRLPVKGMGGGSFHARAEPRIGSFGQQTPQYQAMFSSYVGQLEEHLREKGWLEMAYVYWFDEPAPKDYAFVADGMRRLKKYAPGLARMLTEEPGDNELAGLVDIWCPVSFNYNHDQAERRRADGQRFWWYVCTGPKAPYCTLFIDHPATELRVWLWQTWQRKIVGVLVWSSNYWTSSAAFPDEPQNPYEDPMGYRSGYSTPRGVKAFWGNGDGRFIYPPEAAAVPGASGPGPVIEPPVSSIRWEMLREGIEDYEMLYLLRELLGNRGQGLAPEQRQEYESLLEVPETITSSMTEFTTLAAPIYARRAQIAEAIERLVELAEVPQ